MKLKNYLLAAAAALMLSACQTPQIGYFQNMPDGEITQLQAPRIITAQQGDKLSILVSSKNPELAYLFNLPIVGHYSASSSDVQLNTSQITSYTVDENGNIDFPVLGSLHVEGMTRSEIVKYIRGMLVEKNLIKDPTVTVSFLDLTYSVLGEVKEPGRFNIDHDKVTLIDALSRAGDLTIYGKRQSVLLTREENGKLMSYRIDLTDPQKLYNSPAYYLRQNDMIYVEPNDTRAREATVNGNNIRSTSFWISIASLLTSIAVLVIK